MESIVMIVAMLAVMYFFVIRPDSQRKKKAQEMRGGVQHGAPELGTGGGGCREEGEGREEGRTGYSSEGPTERGLRTGGREEGLTDDPIEG